MQVPVMIGGKIHCKIFWGTEGNHKNLYPTTDKNRSKDMTIYNIISHHKGA
jgi:hypothetical protein